LQFLLNNCPIYTREHVTRLSTEVDKVKKKTVQYYEDTTLQSSVDLLCTLDTF
jgi:hypothetical protein